MRSRSSRARWGPLQPPEAFGRLLREAQATHRLPSVSAAVVRGGEVVWADAVGIADADGTEATPDTQYRVGSITKTFTAAAVVLLRDEGSLDLDDSLERHIPGVAHPSLTIRRMLAHSSGLQREPPGEVWDTLEFPEIEELLAGLGDAEQILPCGEWRHYSNLAYALLGEVVARASGTPYMQFVDERLRAPLGLARTTWRAQEPAARGYYVDPYAGVLRPEPDLEKDGLASVGSLWSTTGDLCRWASYLAGREAMHQVQIMDDPDDWTLGWGLGLMLTRKGDRVWFGHGGGMPGFLASLYYRRREGIGAAVLTNASTPHPAVDALGLDLAERALELLPAEPEPWRPEEVPPPGVEEILGTWWSEGAQFTFVWEGGRLKAWPTDVPTRRATSWFAQEGPDRFRTAEGRERGEVLRVVRGDDGRVEKLYWATYPFTREPKAFG